VAKRNLNKVKSPTEFRRSRVRREYTTAVRQESALQAIGDLQHGCDIFGFTKGQFSMIDVLEHCLKQTGPAHLFIATWSAAAADIQAAHKFLQNGRILSIRLLVDYSFQSRKPEFCRELVNTFGVDAIRVTVTHAKYCMIRNDDWDLVIRTSMNLNYNPRFENYEISDSREMAEFHEVIISEIWDSQEAGEAFEARPHDNFKDFKKTFERQASIYSNDITDGRDIF